MKRLSLGVLSLSAIVTASSSAWAEVPAQTWSELRGHNVIVETEAHDRVGGKLIGVEATTIAILRPDGESLVIDRANVHTVREAERGESLPPLGPAKEEVSGGVAWHSGDPVPPGYRLENGVGTDLLIAGAVVFGLAWLGAGIGAGVSAYPVAAIPVAGPWIPVAAGLNKDSMTASFAALYAVDGVLQAVGLGLLIGGAVSGKTVIRSNVSQAKTWWMPAPMSFGNGGVGLGIIGRM